MVVAMRVGALMLQLLVTALAASSPIALPGCPESCGDVRVAYPFGIGEGCFYEGFNLTCDGTQHPPKLFLGDSMEVLDISLPDGTVRIQSTVLQSSRLPDLSGPPFSTELNGSWSVPDATGPLKVSSSRNTFVAFGCNVVAQLIPHSTLGQLTYASICTAMCSDTASSTSCSGVGCCRTSISPSAGDLPSYGIKVKHLIGQTEYRRVSSVFIVNQEWFSQNEGEMITNFNQFLPMVQSVPTVLEWSLELISDTALFRLSSLGPNSSDYRCRSVNSFSYLVYGNYDQRRCNCSQGYDGNPYLSDGCQDIDECQQPDIYPCHGTCINLPGKYECVSKKSIKRLQGLITIIAISAGFGLLFSLFGVTKITKKLKQRRAKRQRQAFFKENRYGAPKSMWAVHFL